MGKVKVTPITQEDAQKLEKWEKENKLKTPKGVKKVEVKVLTKEEFKKQALTEAQAKRDALAAIKEEAQPAAKVKPTPKKEAPAATQPSVITMEGTLTTKEVAAMVGTTPKALRRVLRAKWYADGKHTNYRWTQDSPVLAEIIKHYEGAEKAKA